MTGHGGWPLNAFLTPEQAPFYAGTYFPPEPRHGLPSWRMVLRRGRRGVGSSGARRSASRAGGSCSRWARPPGSSPRREPIREDAARRRGRRPAARPTTAPTAAWGGAPKFPPALDDRAAARRAASARCRSARCGRWPRGGIYDQVGGGFSRYAVDATWTVPHFEKMLYDNALLARAYLHGWQVSGEERLREVCCETLDWALREMRGPEGGFCSALDADSEGVEGKFYVWTRRRAARGARRGARRRRRSRTSARPSRELRARAERARGPRPAPPGAARRDPPPAATAPARERVRPGLDDKRLTSWNALMISALAEAGAVLERARLPRAAAVGCADVRAPRTLRDADGRPAAHVEGRRGRSAPTSRTTRYLLEALITPVRGDVRPALVPARRRALADAIDRALLRPRARRLLHHRRRPRAARRAAQGPRGLADPVGQLGGRVRAAAARAAVRRGQLRAPRARRAAAAVPARGAPPAGVRAPAAGRGLLPGAGQARWRSSGPMPRPARCCASSAASTARTSCWPPAAADGVPAARRARAGRRPRRRLRVRALRLPGAGDERREALARRCSRADAARS